MTWRGRTSRSRRDGKLPGPAAAVALVLVAGSTAMVASLGAPLVPAVAREFDIAYAAAQWNLTGPLLVGAVAMPVFGAFGAGRTCKPFVVAGLALITSGSVLTTFSPTFAAFLTGRCLQGVGLALTPLAIAAAREHFDGPRQQSLISVLSVATVAGAGVAHPAASVMAAEWGVRGTFAIASVVNASLLLVSALAFPASRRSRRGGNPDVVGILLMGTGVTGSLVGLGSAPVWGWSSPATLALLGTGVVATTLWVTRTLAGHTGLVDLRLAAGRGLLEPHAVSFLAALGVFAMVSLATLVTQDTEWGLGESVALAGFLQLPYSVTSVIGSRVALATGRRVGMTWVLPVGCGIFALQAFTLAVWHGDLLAIAVCMALGGIGGGFTLACIPLLIIPHVSQEGTASMLAFSQVLRCVGSSAGSALGITVFVLLGDDARALALTAVAIGGSWVTTGLLLILRSSRSRP